jgi:tyrosyl-tRNA synthetase
MPLLEGLDGREKMSKSLGNYVGISEPPGEMFGKLMSISDELMWRYITLLSFESSATVEKWQAQVAGGGNPRDVKARFAREIVARFHGARAAGEAEAAFDSRFRRGELPQDMPEVRVAAGGTFAQILKLAGLVDSTSEANRVIEQGGVKIDGERLADRAARAEAGRSYVMQVGKRKFARVTVK